MKRWLPFPLLSLALLAMWLLLNQTLAAGHVVLGALIGAVAGGLADAVSVEAGLRRGHFAGDGIVEPVGSLGADDVLSALVEQGHTVVPYHLVQDSEERGWIAVYDPNRPDLIDADKPRVIEFDLRRDRYSYGAIVSMEQDDVGMIAVRQDAYMGRGTAVLATVGSALVSPRRAWRSLTGGDDAARAE